MIRGHGSCGLEVWDELPDADVVVVCCGGGGLLAGVAAAIKTAAAAAGRSPPRVLGVEPVGANSMWLSMQRGGHQWCDGGGKTSTVAHGLAPPFAGRACYRHAERFVDGIVLVTDDEMRAAARLLFGAGVVAEVSGAAAVAAVQSGKVFGEHEHAAGKKVVCVVSGRNIGFDEYASAISDLGAPMTAH